MAVTSTEAVCLAHRRWRLTGMAELHYTSTLEDAQRTEIPINVNAAGGATPVTGTTFGNRANRIDVLNLATGLVAQCGRLTVTSAAIVPLRTGTDRTFDAALYFQAERRF